jgi:hypothetical protein
MIETTAARLWIVATLATASVVVPVRSQGAGDSHEFTGKSGQKLVAKVLGVSEDRRQMRILRQDGMEFDTEIVIFSLDDQQYVKDWMKVNASTASATPGMSSGAGAGAFRLEVAITRTPGKSEKHRDEFYTMEEKESLFRITVRNLSRETLTGARLEYAIAWKDTVTIYFDEDEQEWEFSSRDLDSPRPPVKKLGEAVLEPLRFNGEGGVETEAVRIDEVFYGGNELYGQDELLGVKVRVIGADGAVLHESDSGGAAITAMPWDEIKGLADPRVID